MSDAIPPVPPVLTKVYKLIFNNPDGSPGYQYFTDGAKAAVTESLLQGAGTTISNFGVNTFQADVSSVDLTAFFKAGGMVVGPIELK